ncbi:MAG: hypothetical protein Kow0059_18910 [Candidatus Sumerlaeia bacterium]
MSPIYVVAAAVIGVALGALLGWALTSARLSAAMSAIAAARDTAEKQLDETRRRLEESQAEQRNLLDRLQTGSAELARTQAELESARNLLQEKDALYQKQLREAREMQDKAIGDLREAFRAMSAEALRENAPEFLRLASAAFEKLQEASKGDLEKRQEAIAGLLKPLQEHLRMYQERLQQAESAQATALGEVKKQLEMLASRSEELATETERFRQVLRSSGARGRWGEETLRRVVEAAGMSAHCDFQEQSAEGDKKPDMIVRLPGERIIIVDAKAPDLDVFEALNVAEPERRSRLLQDHARKLRRTIQDLARRNYPAAYPNALDYVVLFLPAESLFSAALEGDRDLIVWAAEQRIMLATPASLIALLRAVSLSWLQFEQSRSAQEIALAAKEFYSRVSKFFEHFENIRAGLARAAEAYNEALGSFERRVRPSGERLLKLRFDAGERELPEIAPLEIALRQPMSIEDKADGERDSLPEKGEDG